MVERVTLTNIQNQETNASSLLGLKSFLSDVNVDFLQGRLKENNLNEAIDISRVAWTQFPRVRESAEIKTIVASLMEDLEGKFAQHVITPMSTMSSSLSIVIDRLQNLVDKNPTLIEQGFDRALQQFQNEIRTIEIAIKEPNAKISELNQMINQLIYKPIVKGNAGETVLAEAWSEVFARDQLIRLGGPAKEDLLVTPFLNDGAQRYGESMIVERKTGSQKFNGSHTLEAVAHAKARAASYAILVFDTQNNLPSRARPVSVNQEQGILIVASDLSSGSWKIARELLEVIQQQLAKSHRNIQQINLDSLEQAISELGAVHKLLEQVTASNAKIKSHSNEIEQSIIVIRTLVKNHQERILLAIDGIGAGH